MATGHKCYPNMERFDGQKCQLHDTIVAIYDNITMGMCVGQTLSKK